MKAIDFLQILEELGGGFYTGVPDSLLKPVLDEITGTHGVTGNHIVAANEGAAAGIAAGHYLATGKPAVVYMQNSGLGNAVNPVCSLMHKKVYAIPAIFVIGWRGEPGVKDEPQHLFQGEITLKLLELLEIPYAVLPDDETSLTGKIKEFKQQIITGQSVAFVLRKDSVEASTAGVRQKTDATLLREEALEAILGLSDETICVCTTGKLSREVFEIRARQRKNQAAAAVHRNDFLTVGSMGHAISIALGIAKGKTALRVVCLDGDGAALMHMGSLAIAGIHGTKNLVHIVINNGAHESVGGMPTACSQLSLAGTAKTLGYKKSLCLKTTDEINAAKEEILRTDGPVFIELMTKTGSRSDLGRPDITPADNKEQFMSYLKRAR